MLHHVIVGINLLLMKGEKIKIRNNEGLLVKPHRVSLVQVPKGTTIRQSVARPQDWPGQGHVSGGATQYEIRGAVEIIWYKTIGTYSDLKK